MLVTGGGELEGKAGRSSTAATCGCSHLPSCQLSTDMYKHFETVAQKVAGFPNLDVIRRLVSRCLVSGFFLARK